MRLGRSSPYAAGCSKANCRKAVASIRWPDGVVRCPHCGSEGVTYLATQKRYECYAKHAKAQFSLEVGTIFEDSPIGGGILGKRLTCMALTGSELPHTGVASLCPDSRKK